LEIIAKLFLPMTNPSFAASGRLVPAFFCKPSIRLVAAVVALVAVIPCPSLAQQGAVAQTPVLLHPSDKDPSPGTPVLLDAMTTELHRAFTSLGKQATGKDVDKQLPPYFLSYSVSDASTATVRAQYGAVVDSSANRARVADIQVRLGEPKLDNTHGTHRGSAVNSM